ncbi:A/G-specific adenine glycosylase [Microbacterium sp. YY-01]|uniref:A/G-specific adenine glycosylase n=1 Tax=Microbacterium sp. YY-01 TaxID=3421634 RepID=UPI003D1857A6
MSARDLSASSLYARLAPWFERAARDLPWRSAEFHARFGAWGVLVSETMLQQTPVARVVPALHDWLALWPTPTDLAAARPADVLRQWSNLGYPRRALRLQQAAVTIRDQHAGVVPEHIDDLLALPGVGDYTARAVAVFAYGQRHPVVDINIRRVIARAVHGKAHPDAARRRDHDDMAALLPDDTARSVTVNAALMELGALVCTARTAWCEQCPLSDCCTWRAAGFPDTGDRRPRQARYEGSDRQARGAVLKQLRESDGHDQPESAVIAEWPDDAQRLRALHSLAQDGLIELIDGRARLPMAANSD